jgi:thiopeptide-type bacteriocin biosynthesis protein
MDSQGSLYAVLEAPRDEHEPIVRELISPLAGDLRQSRELDALFFSRYNKPDWHIGIAVLGRPEWIDGAVRDLLERRLVEMRSRGRLTRFAFAPYERDADRHGGVEGARLAERIFLHDTLACLDWIEAESGGRVGKSRREYCLVMTERILGLMGMTREDRIAFYRYSYSFEIDLGRWGSRELDALDRHYRSIREDLAALFDPGSEPETLWGGAEPARIARECLGSLAPLFSDLIRALSSGRIRRDRVDFAWGLTHMHANRLQIESDAEAILRYFMHRLHEERDVVAIGSGGTRP